MAARLNSCIAAAICPSMTLNGPTTSGMPGRVNPNVARLIDWLYLITRASACGNSPDSASVRAMRARSSADRASAVCVPRPRPMRSEEHTSELQSRFDLVCRLLLEKKNKKLPKNTPLQLHNHHCP